MFQNHWTFQVKLKIITVMQRKRLKKAISIRTVQVVRIQLARLKWENIKMFCSRNCKIEFSFFSRYIHLETGMLAWASFISDQLLILSVEVIEW